MKLLPLGIIFSKDFGLIFLSSKSYFSIFFITSSFIINFFGVFVNLLFFGKFEFSDFLTSFIKFLGIKKSFKLSNLYCLNEIIFPFESKVSLFVSINFLSFLSVIIILFFCSFSLSNFICFFLSSSFFINYYFKIFITFFLLYISFISFISSNFVD